MTEWPPPVEPLHATPRTKGRPLVLPPALLRNVAASYADARSKRWPHPLMPHQRRTLATALQAHPDGSGRPQFRLVVLLLPRQSGKSNLARTVMTAAALAGPGSKVWYTAQTRNDAKDYFLEELVSALEDPGCPLRPLARARLTTGLEHVALPGRSSIRLFAPTRKALHGKQGDLVVLDEAWSLTAERGRELMQAIVPIGNTRPRFQLWITSTAGTDDSGFLRPLLDELRTTATDPEGSSCLIEYAATVDEAADDAELVEAVARAHPALGWTTDRSVLANALTELGRGEFLRAYGNVWTSTGERVISAAVWAAVQSPAPPPHAGPAVLAVDVTPQRDHAAIAAAWQHDGSTRAALVAHAPGTDWCVTELTRLARRLSAAVVIDEGAGASTLIGPLRRNGVRVRTITGRDIARACAELFDDLTAGRLRVTPDPALDTAAAGAVQRPFGDAWAWGRRASSVDISPLCAVTFAVWGDRHADALPMLV